MDQSPVGSPTPKQKETPQVEGTMDFPDALRQVLSGLIITKLEWDNPEIFVELRNEKLMIKLEDNIWRPLIVSYGDMTGTDWVVTAPTKTY